MAARKGILALIAGPPEKGSGAKGKSKPDTDDMGMEAKELAMEDFAEAHEAKDYAGMAKAFKRAYDACRAAESGDEGDEYEED